MFIVSILLLHLHLRSVSREILQFSIFRVVADVVGDLKMMALDMGGELERQNAKLDRINVKVEIYD